LLSAVKVSIFKVISSFGKSIGYCIPALGLIIFTNWIIMLDSEAVVCAGLLGGIFYYLMLIRRDIKLQCELKELLREIKFNKQS